MNEIEVKVLDIDKKSIINKLKNIGADLVKNEDQTNIRFDMSDNSLKKKYHGYLRIRITKDNIKNVTINTLTLKKNISKNMYRINEEIETEISDVDETIKILRSLNLVDKVPGKKHRTSYRYDNILFEIDEWDESIYPHPYLEIEANSKEDIERAIKLLDLDRSKVTAKPLDELIKDI